MTCILGVVENGRTWIGSDSVVSDDNTRAPTLSPKLWRAGGYLVGVAGNGAWYAVVRRLKWPAVASAGWPVAGLPQALVSAAGELGLDFPAEKGTPLDGSMLVGGAGKLWYADSDLSVDEYTMIGAGSGDEAARAVLEAVPRGRARARILRALSAVARVRFDVGPPFAVDVV